MIYRTKKSVAAGCFNATSLGSIQKHTDGPRLKHICKRKHIWVQSKYSRRCTRCGLEEERDPVTGLYTSNPKVRGPRTDEPERTAP